MLSTIFSLRRSLSASALIAGLFMLYQYLDSKWKSRIEHSLEYAILYQSPEKVDARNAADLWSRKIGIDNVVQAGDVLAATKGNDGQLASNDSISAPSNTHYGDCFISIKEYQRTYLDEYEKTLDNKSKSDIRNLGYHYSLPEILLSYWNTTQNTYMSPCEKYLQEFEVDMANIYLREFNALEKLHELKQFYAAVAICTTSGICDSLVACEIFFADMHSFGRKWGIYFALWTPKEGQGDYWRVGRFLDHCSKPLFFKYSATPLKWHQSFWLAFVGFWNVWAWA